MKKGKIIILSAPSGSGKSTIISNIINNKDLDLEFSISATSRAPRGNECHGREYYFLSPKDFEKSILEGKFVEWEEVYAGTKYGTLRSEVERILDKGHNLIMDVDVKGAMNIKDQYGDEALSIFILPPDIETLESRLRNRNTDDEKSLRKRIDKAGYEMKFADSFDLKVVNDQIEKAVCQVEKAIIDFIN